VIILWTDVGSIGFYGRRNGKTLETSLKSLLLEFQSYKLYQNSASSWIYGLW